MVADKWLLVLEIPILVFLVRSIQGRIARLNARIEEVKREEPNGPANPYQALFDALDEAGGPGSIPQTQAKATDKRRRSASSQDERPWPKD
jgi:hypothetical protein